MALSYSLRVVGKERESKRNVVSPLSAGPTPASGASTAELRREPLERETLLLLDFRAPTSI